MLVATGKKLANMKEIRGSRTFDMSTGCSNTFSTRIFGESRDHLFQKKYIEYGKPTETLALLFW